MVGCGEHANVLDTTSERNVSIYNIVLTLSNLFLEFFFHLYLGNLLFYI